MLVGHDTRESSPRLIDALIKGINLMNGKALNYKQVTTPQIHWIIAKVN